MDRRQHPLARDERDGVDHVLPARLQLRSDRALLLRRRHVQVDALAAQALGRPEHRPVLGRQRADAAQPAAVEAPERGRRGGAEDPARRRVGVVREHVGPDQRLQLRVRPLGAQDGRQPPPRVEQRRRRAVVGAPHGRQHEALDGRGRLGERRRNGRRVPAGHGTGHRAERARDGVRDRRGQAAGAERQRRHERGDGQRQRDELDGGLPVGTAQLVGERVHATSVGGSWRTPLAQSVTRV